MTNMLMQYGLTRDGDESGTKAFDQQVDEEGYAQLRMAIQVCRDFAASAERLGRSWCSGQQASSVCSALEKSFVRSHCSGS